MTTKQDNESGADTEALLGGGSQGFAPDSYFRKPPLEVARRFSKAGLSVVAIPPDGSKRPVTTWAERQKRLPTDAELDRDFGDGRNGIAIICGAVSGNLETLDIDDPALVKPFEESVNALAPGLLDRLPTVATPRNDYGGRHYRYRILGAVGGNQRLARSADGKVVLIETRGEGGYAIAPGSPGGCHESGLPYRHVAGPPIENVPTITADEHETLLGAARSFDQHIEPAREAPQASATRDGLSPGDDYNQRASWDEILASAGWAAVHSSGDKTYWRRPGKRSGVSATSGLRSKAGNELFYVFSSNAAPFDPSTPYSKFAAYATLNHRGDFSAAASALAAQGYGDRTTATGEGHRPQRSSIKAKVLNMSEVEPMPVRFTWPPRVPRGCITVIGGKPAEGKSTVASSDLAARVTRGINWPDGAACEKGSVVILSCEDDPNYTIRPRLDAAGADVSKVLLITGAERYDPASGEQEQLLLTLEDVGALREVLASITDPALLIVDPFGSFVSGRTDTYRDNQTRNVLAPIAALARDFDLAALIVCHRKKSTDAPDADSALLGSRAITALARSVWHVSRDPANDTRRLFLPGKQNLAPPQPGLAFAIGGNPPKVIWESAPVHMTADEAYALERKAERRGSKSTATSKAMEFLSKALAAGERLSKDIEDEAKANGIGKGAISNAREKLGVECYRPVNPGPWFMRLPGAELGRLFA
jgi:hypothetical protein